MVNTLIEYIQLNEGFKFTGELRRLNNYVKKSVPDVWLDVEETNDGWFEVMIQDNKYDGSDAIGYFKTDLTTWQWRNMWGKPQSGTAFDSLSKVKAFIKKTLVPEIIKSRPAGYNLDESIQ